MSDMTREPFIIGFGTTGEVLWNFGRFPPQKFNADWWSYMHQGTDRPSLLPDITAQRLVEAGWCRIEPSPLPPREAQLVMTDKGAQQLVDWCWRRAIELSNNAEHRPPVAQESVHHPGRAAVIAGLVERALDTTAEFAAKKAMTREPLTSALHDDSVAHSIGIDDAESGSRTPLSAWFQAAPNMTVRTRRVRAAIEAVAEAAMHGLPLGHMPQFAALFGQLAQAAFQDAPNQDWEPGSEDDADEAEII